MTAKQRRFVAALLVGHDRPGAEAAAGISARTAARYLALPAVADALAQGTAAAFQGAAAQAAPLVGEAMGALRGIMADPLKPAGVRCRAALGIIEAATRLHEVAVLEGRIRALEDEVMGNE